jgi:hypothetical protein
MPGHVKQLVASIPHLTREWHPTKNLPLTPYDLTYGSRRKVWWKCGNGHEWQAPVWNRYHGRGCPVCANRTIVSANFPAAINPTLAAQWHPSKNGTLAPQDIAPNSNRKVWWLCPEGHEWCASANTRARGTSCPFCSGRRPTVEECLLKVNPDLAAEWHPTKNGGLTPRDVSSGSGKRIWWRCRYGHEWDAVVTSRAVGRGCPYCSGRYPTEESNLAVSDPCLAAEWHPTRNGELTPNDVTGRSNKKVWWQCRNGHEWNAGINNRSKDHGCPYCFKKRRSARG